MLMFAFVREIRLFTKLATNDSKVWKYLQADDVDTDLITQDGKSLSVLANNLPASIIGQYGLLSLANRLIQKIGNAADTDCIGTPQ